MKEVVDLIEKFDAILTGLIGTKSYFDEQYSDRKARLEKEMDYAYNSQLTVVILMKNFLDHIETTRTNDAHIINKYNEYVDALKSWTTQFATNESALQEIQEQLTVFDKNNRTLRSQNRQLNEQVDQYDRLLRETKAELHILKGIKKDREANKKDNNQEEYVDPINKNYLEDEDKEDTDDGEDSDDDDGREDSDDDVSPAQRAIDELIKESPDNFFKQVPQSEEDDINE